MAHSLFEGLGGLDGQQTTLAVQSLLDSQTTNEIPQDDGDIFQCGRCKRQYTSLTEFMSHKEKCATPAVPKAVRPTILQSASIGGGQNSAFTATLPHLLSKQNVNLSGATAVYGNTLGQSLVLSEEEFATLTSIDNPNLNLQAQQINITFQGGNPVLSQIASGPLTPQQSSTVTTSPTLTGAVASLSSANSAFTSTVPSSSLEQEVEISDVVVNEESVNEPTAPQLSSNSISDASSSAAHVSAVTVSANQNPSSSSVANTLVTQQGAVVEGTTVEGLTLGTLPNGALQFQQIQLAGAQTQPIVLAQGLTGSQANLIHGISIVKPTPSKPTSTKKDGYAILQTQLSEPYIAAASQVELQPTAQKAKGRAKVDKAATSEEGGKKKLRCTYCDKPFSKNFDLQQHIRSHTGEKPFQCIVCGRAFAQKSNVKKHMQTHKVWPKAAVTLPDDPIILLEKNNTDGTAVTMAKQEEEPSSASTSSDKNSNVSMMIDSSYNCQYCAQKFTSYFRLKSHMVMHKSEQVYKCIHEKCSCTFKDLDAYLEHTKTHENEMEYNCHICNKKFSALYDLGVHQYSHSLYPNQGSKPGPKYYKCGLCGNKYTSTTALKHHLDSTDHKFPCPQCHKTFQCERALRRHITTHNESLEFVCEICEKGFKTQQYLKLHMLNHQKETPWECDICGVAFNRKDKLKRHKIIHEPNKKYKCPFRNHTGCDKAFNRADKLKAHIISHSGIKPFKCRYCSKTFSRRPHLNEHIRVHEGNYRFYCSKCKKGFNRRNLFRMHNCHCGGGGNKDDDRTESETETVGKPPRRPIFNNKKMKRKPGRPRKVVFVDAAEALNKVKRPVGRPKKMILPYLEPASAITSQVSTSNTTVTMVKSSADGRLGQTSSDGQAPVLQQLSLPLDNYDNVVGEDGENVVHVQLVTDQQGPMLAQDLEQQQVETGLKSEAAAAAAQQQQPGISFVGSLTQEQLQEIFLTGNTHNVKLMETTNGETFVIDEASSQILAQINTSSSPQQPDVNVSDDPVGLYPDDTTPSVITSDGAEINDPNVTTEVISSVTDSSETSLVDGKNLSEYESASGYAETLEDVYQKNQDLCKKENT